MAAFDFSAGAGGMGDALQDLLKQKFLEQITRAKLTEDARQADMQNALGQGQLGLGHRRVDVDVDQFGQRIGEDKRQFDVSAGQRDRTIKLDEDYNPFKIANTSANTSELLRRPVAEREERDFITGRDKTQHGYRLGELGAEQAGAMRMLNARQAGAAQGPLGTQNEALDTAQEAKRLAGALRQHKGFGGAFGLADSYLPTLRQDTADAEVLRDSLRSLLTLENMGKMKGVLSDNDMKVLQQASTTLNAKMSNPAAAAELTRLEQVMERAITAMGGSPQAPAGDSGNVTMVDPRGRRLSVPAAKVQELEALGAKRVGG